MKKVFRKELTIRGKDDSMTKLSLDSSLKIEQQEKKNVRIKRRVAILVQRNKVNEQTNSKENNIFGEFDPGSGQTLAACLTHASRTDRTGKLFGVELES